MRASLWPQPLPPRAGPSHSSPHLARVSLGPPPDDIYIRRNYITFALRHFAKSKVPADDRDVDSADEIEWTIIAARNVAERLEALAAGLSTICWRLAGRGTTAECGTEEQERRIRGKWLAPKPATER